MTLCFVYSDTSAGAPRFPSLAGSTRSSSPTSAVTSAITSVRTRNRRSWVQTLGGAAASYRRGHRNKDTGERFERIDPHPYLVLLQVSVT